MAQKYKRRPHWLKVPGRTGDTYQRVRRLIDRENLHTVCKSAHCPNIGECWERGTATFMILGDVCTRNCGFCAVTHSKPLPVDEKEPQRIAEAIRQLALKYAVITSVTRDDLPDGGAYIFAESIQAIRKMVPECKIEVLIPDFQGVESALKKVLDAKPTVLNHNVETVPRLYPVVRPQAIYQRSLQVLERAAGSGAITKSGIMVGLGEYPEEIQAVMHDLRQVGGQILTIGQYMQPSRFHRPIDRFVTPDEFRQLKTDALAMGFRLVEAAPLVRSSYHAENASKLSLPV